MTSIDMLITERSEEDKRQDEADVLNQFLPTLVRLRAFERVLQQEGFSGRALLCYSAANRMQRMEKLIVKMNEDMQEYGRIAELGKKHE